MDAKEIKSLLKQARDAIKEKNFKAALKHCKAVLKSDKNNYNAWVFVGVAAQEIDQPDQSEAAFKKAIEISDDQLLAWQGLCNFYEKHETEENIPELLFVYKQLLEFFASDKEKKLEIFDKLITLLKKLDDKEKLLKVLKSKLEMLKEDKEKEYLLQKQIFQELTGLKKLSDSEKEMLTNAVQALTLHETFSDDDCKRIISSCIDILFKNGEKKYALSLALVIYQRFPQNMYCIEFLCRVGMNSYIENGVLTDMVEELFEKIPAFPSTSLLTIFKGFHKFVSKKYHDAVQKFKEGLKSMEYCIQGWYFLSSSQLQLHLYNDAERSAKKGIEILLKSVESSTLLGKFYLLLGKALSGRDSWDASLKALEKCASILGQDKELLITFSFTLLKIGQVSKAEEMCCDLQKRFPDDSEVLQLEGYIFLLNNQFDEAMKRLRLSLSKVESAFTLHLIGLVLWETQEKDKAFKVFIKSVELDNYFAKNFLYLGHFYRYHASNKSKACLCYKKAFELDSSDTETCMSYSNILKDLGKEEENIEVLKIITEKPNSISCKWAWTQLGLCQLHKNLLSEAIHSFQNALKADPMSSSGWECLADAYLKRGSYESALKVFEKVAEINPKAMYPLYQIATIQKIRGFFSDAIEKFKTLLEIVPSYVPALIGLAETLVLLAKKSFGDCLYGKARDCCQETLNTLTKVAITKPGLASLWKLAGDACTLPFDFDEKWFPIMLPPELHQQSDKGAILCNKYEILAFGSEFFGRALLIKDNVSTLWHDLGVNCHLQSILSINTEEKLNFAKKALICLQKAISIAPNYDGHWTALGVIALSEELKDYAFGQHAFIKSLKTNALNAETWSNLGVLYLQQGNIKLSHSSFKNAQSSEPTYPLSWVGQAFIADQVKHTETLDLYRHAATLGSHKEALIGYSRLVCETLLNTTNKDSYAYKYNIEQMNAVLVGADCAVKFVANNEHSGEAFNMLGMLLERQGINNASLKAYETAIDLLESSNKTELVESVRANYARMLSVVGMKSESTKEFLKLKKIDVSVILSFALALFRDRQYEQAYKLFSQAFEKTKNINEKSQVKVAMAIVASNMKGPDAPNYLSLLVESAQISPVSVPGLLALYAEGILKEEAKLIAAAQKEFQPYKYLKEYSTSASFLWAAQAYNAKGAQAARNELLKFLHCFPSNPEMWLQAACCLLQWDTKYAETSYKCAKVGLFHGGCKEQSSQIFALCQMAMGCRRKALVAAQKAVHISPGKLTNWAILAAACHVADLDREHVGWMFSFVRKLAKEQVVKTDFLGWFIVMEIFHYINSGDMTVAGSLASQALSISSFDSDTQSCLQILDAVVKVFTDNGNLQPLFLAVKDNPKSFFGWNVLSQLLMVSEKSSEAEKTISHFSVVAEKIFPKWTAYPLVQLALLFYKEMHNDSVEKEKWLRLGEEVSYKAVQHSSNNQAARFMQGLFALERGNKSLAKKSLDKVLSNGTFKDSKWLEEAASKIIETHDLKKKGK